ncbi:zinc finger protein 518B [Brienomyrus brachyistius]|uniref:zinc finger protein 518B n=1 Tax=Brienomyrus brachyistius TaxID=42636 RepID=UPI0020B3EA83|nr:zinc finger protein 518B [Brienomyrus brachyistius]XP_048826782.1 zinc finger protein 518B [Brienomyrus brachyistius]
MNPGSQHQDVFISFVESGWKQRSKAPPHSLELKLKTSDKHYCDKCRFSSRDGVQFQKHVSQHAEMTFSCSYCSHVSYTKGESQRHLVQHTGIFPFKCQFCEYGAIRNDYIVKHTERVHRIMVERANKVKRKQFTVKNGLRVPSALHSSVTRMPGTTVASGPATGTDGNSNKVITKEKLDNANRLAKVQVELLAPLNEPIQPDRPLTVTYPPELSIPPGCFLELVEVKTVNGTKELELKLVSQQSIEGERPEKSLAGRTGECMGENENVNVAKASYHCGLISQCEKTVVSSPSVSKQDMQQHSNFSLIKNLLAAPPAGDLKLRQNSKETLMTLKEEPEECEIELGDKIQLGAPTNKGQMLMDERQEQDRKLLINLKDSVVSSQTRVTPECVGQQKSSSKRPLEVELDSSSCEKQTKTGSTQIQTASNKSCPLKGPAILKCENCPVDSMPVVRPSSQTNDGDVHAADLQSGELPIISSVFSLHRGPEDIPACVGWEATRKRQLQSVPVAPSVEGQSAGGTEPSAVQEPGITVTSSASTVLVNSVSVSTSSSSAQEGTKYDPEMDCPKNVTPNISQIPLPKNQSSSQKVAVLDQSKSRLNKIPTNITVTVNSPENQKNAEGSQPTFIPEGTMLKISSCLSKSSEQQSSHARATENSFFSENWVPRTVLSSDASKHNISSTNMSAPCKGLKLSLKRRRSGAENEGMDGHWVQQDTQYGEEQSHSYKQSKERKKSKKDKKTSKLKVFLEKSGTSEGDLSRQRLIPLKEDQLVTSPAPNQPVVILNHPRPRASTVHPKVMSKHVWTTDQDVSFDTVESLLKMKLKKVNRNKYQVVGFVYRDPARMIMC